MLRILAVEDDASIATFLESGLTEAGHLASVVRDGRDGLISATTEQFDVIILDRMLPSVDGIKILHALRASGDSTPVLILSALGEVDDRVKGLKAGGDDYLTKPFSMVELLARIEALARRPALLGEPVAPTMTVGPLLIDTLGQIVKRDGKRIELTPREFRILCYLARHCGRVVTRTMLLEAVWDYSFDPQTNIVDQHVSKLRQKIDTGFDTPLIHTVRGSGYVMRTEP